MCTVKVIQWNWSQQPFVPAVPLFLLRSYRIPGRFSPHCLTEAVWGLGVVSYSFLFIAFFLISHSMFLLPLHSSFCPREAICKFHPKRTKSTDKRHKNLVFAFMFLCIFKMYGSCLNFSRIRGTFSCWEIFSSQEIWLEVMMYFASCLCVSTLVRSCSVLQVVILGA